MSKFSFDPVNKYIKVLSPNAEVTALEMYGEAMDYADSEEGVAHPLPMAAVGKAPLGGEVYTDSIFMLTNGWKIKFYDGTYQAKVTGTVITDDETQRTVAPDSGNVEVVFQVSSQATVLGQVEVDNKLAAIKTDIELVRAVEAGRWKIASNQMIFYDENNVTEVMRFNLFDKNGQPSESNVFERSRV